MKVIDMIAAQQEGKEGTPEWMVGQQLADICRREPESAALVEKDLDTITLKMVAEKLKAKADEIHKTTRGACVCIPPCMAEEIIRHAYGLPEMIAEEAQTAPATAPAPGNDILDLADFL